jgi:imidazolonepropionase
MTGATLFRDCTLATLHGGDWGLIERGALIAQDGAIAWLGPERDLPAGLPVQAEHGLQGTLLTPGLIDCHTHLVYGGHRAHEADLRLQGASYEDIARAGGGIRSTVAATRAASEADLLRSACARADALMREGLTTVEVKSGYGLTLADEAKCLRVARELGESRALSVRTTYLGAHALPPEFDGRADDYISAVCDWMAPLHKQGLVDAVDAFCDTIGFTPAQTQRVFSAAQSLGLPVKLHAEQLSHQGGAELAASFGALSCDHIEHLSPEGIAAMRAAGTVAVLLPAAWYCLRDTTPPPVAALRAAGVPMAVSTDHNPGSSPCLSLLTALHMACTFWRLTPLEALLGATTHAAQALGLRDRGILALGQRADLAAWKVNHPRELTYWLGGQPCSGRAVAGQWLPLNT